jgi:hypothetical protein
MDRKPLIDSGFLLVTVGKAFTDFLTLSLHPVIRIHYCGVPIADFG